VLFHACLFQYFVAGHRTQATEEDLIRPDLPYQADRRDPILHDVDFSVVVTPPYHCRLLRVWLPLPQSDFAQEIADRRLTTSPMEVEPKIGTASTYGNKFAYFGRPKASLPRSTGNNVRSETRQEPPFSPRFFASTDFFMRSINARAFSIRARDPSSFGSRSGSFTRHVIWPLDGGWGKAPGSQSA